MEKKYDLVTVGHALVDIRIIVDKFPGPDEEAVVLNQTWGAGGSAVNVAIDASRLGLRTAVIAKIGFDNFGRIIVDELLKEGVDVSGLRISSRGGTGFTIVAIDRNGDITMYGFKGAAEELEPSEVDAEVIMNSRYVHIASLRIDTTIKAIEIAKNAGAKISWDPGRVLAKKGLKELEKIIKSVDIVLANKYEVAAITGLDVEKYRESAKILKDLGPELIIVKLGPKGVYALGKDIDEEVPALKVDRVVDTTGAGDAFAAGLIAGIVKGYSIKKAIIYANAVAALKISRLGSHEVPTHKEVVEYIWKAL